MNDEETQLAQRSEDAESRTTDAYDAMEIEDESEVTELTDEDILFETDDRD